MGTGDFSIGRVQGCIKDCLAKICRTSVAGSQQLRVLYRSDMLVVVDKPARVPCQPTGYKAGGVLNLITAQLQHETDNAAAAGEGQEIGVVEEAATQQGALGTQLLEGAPCKKRRKLERRTQSVPHLVHRLDTDTTGCLMLALGKKACSIAVEAFAARRVRKQYIAICVGQLAASVQADSLGKFTVDRPIKVLQDAESDKPACAKITPFHAVVDEGGQQAVTHFQLLAANSEANLSVFRACPQTGRTHQIRAHLAWLGLPILCDPLYGAAAMVGRESAMLTRHALHAFRLEFDDKGQSVEAVAPIPQDMASVLRTHFPNSANVCDELLGGPKIT